VRPGALGLVAGAVVLVGCAGEEPPPAAPIVMPPVVLTPTELPDAPPMTDGDVTVAVWHGMEILVKRTPGAEFVAAQLFIRGGTRNWTAANAGVEHVALSVATSGGTASLAKTEYSRKLASLGAQIWSDVGNDFSDISAKVPLTAWEGLFPIFVDTFLHPALPASEFDIVKQRELTNRKHEQEDGDGRLWLLARHAVFEGHPYGNRPVGTLESITALKADDMAPQLEKLRDKDRLLLVVVGDVDPAHIIDETKTAFASVPRKAYSSTLIPQLHFSAAHVSGDPFKLPTNYVESVFAGPAWDDPDFIPMWLGMHLLGQRVFDEVRTKRNLSYAPNAYENTRIAAPFGILYVTAVDPNAAMKVMFDEARRLGTELIPKKELDASKATFLSGYLQGHETVDGQASDLGAALLVGGDWRLARTNIERLRATTPEAVRDAAKRWLVNMQTAIVGDPTKLDPKVVGAQ
jgi:predicted Zn-dependent peptidase